MPRRLRIHLIAALPEPDLGLRPAIPEPDLGPLRSGLTPAEQERARQIGRIGYRSTDAKRPAPAPPPPAPAAPPPAAVPTQTVEVFPWPPEAHIAEAERLEREGPVAEAQVHELLTRIAGVKFQRETGWAAWLAAEHRYCAQKVARHIAAGTAVVRKRG